MKLYVGNLPYNVAEDDLRQMFTEFGNVGSVNVITDKFSGQSKGFGFIEMQDNAEAQAAIDGLNESPHGGRNIKVNQARPREERPGRAAGGGNNRW